MYIYYNIIYNIIGIIYLLYNIYVYYMILIIMYSVTNTYKIHFQLSARKACIFEGLNHFRHHAKIITNKKSNKVC